VLFISVGVGGMTRGERSRRTRVGGREGDEERRRGTKVGDVGGRRG
jgi:hypothetical protein